MDYTYSHLDSQRYEKQNCPGLQTKALFRLIRQKLKVFKQLHIRHVATRCNYNPRYAANRNAETKKKKKGDSQPDTVYVKAGPAANITRRLVVSSQITTWEP